MNELLMFGMADIETWKTASFEEKYKSMLTGMSEADLKRSTEQLAHHCQCSKCPTFKEHEGVNQVFCTFGRSGGIQEQKGCLCSTCAVTKTMSLRWEYYCTQGSAVELSDL